MNKTEKTSNKTGTSKDKGKLEKMNDSDAQESDSKTESAKNESMLSKMNGEKEKS